MKSTQAQGAMTCMLVEAIPGARPSLLSIDPQPLLGPLLTELRGQILGEPVADQVLCLAFPTPADAAAALPAIRGALAPAVGGTQGLRVAIGADSGPQLDGWAVDDLLEQTALLLPLAHGGQTLLSAETAALLAPSLPPAFELRPLGAHRLPDLRTVQTVVQLCNTDEPDSPTLPSLDHLPNNLSVQLTNFVGRRESMRTVQSLLRTNRLVTLTGAGGSGKTRLALQVGASLLGEFPGGVWFVDLSSLSDPDLVLSTVAAALRVKEQPGRPAIESVAQSLAGQRTLILLDNCEHLVTSCAHLMIRLLPAAPMVTVLATSREPLGVPGEVNWSVPALRAPSAEIGSVDSLQQFDAVRLFVQRARASNPAFVVTEQNRTALAAICRSLDGIPLAIELAAARTRILSVEQIQERLHDRLQLLTAGRRMALARHQTLRASVDWSYDLLGREEQLLWQRLAIFAGTFSLEAVEAICGVDGLEEADLLSLLSQLVDKSLVMATDHQGAKRFWLLETMRQYGRSLWEANEEDRLAHLHCDWYVQMLQQANPRGGPAWSHERLAVEQDNLRQALQWAMESRAYEQAFRLCGRLYSFWNLRGQGREAWARLTPLAAMPEPPVSPEARAQVLHAVGTLAAYRGELRLSLAYLHQALDLSTAVKRPGFAYWVHNNLGMVYHEKGETAAAKEQFERCLALHDAPPHRIAMTHAHLASLYLDLGQTDLARREIEVSYARLGPEDLATQNGYLAYIFGRVEIAERQFGPAEVHLQQALASTRAGREELGIGHALAGLGESALYQQNWEQARQYLVESLAHLYRAYDLTAVAMVVEHMAWLAVAVGEHQRALRLAGGLAALRTRMELTIPEYRANRLEGWLAPAWKALGAAGQEAFAEGQALTVEALIELANVEMAPPERAVVAAVPVEVAPTLPVALTVREREIVQLLAAGLTAREIGKQLFLSPRTVEKHEENLRNKLAVPNRAALVAWAAQHGLA